jgi:fumarate hydratase class II
MVDGYRREKDSLGEMQVPVDALYGAQTQRAVENFPISGQRFGRRFIQALGLIKKCAAETNSELGNLDAAVAEAIAAAAGQVADGAWDDQFVLDIYQTGSGTSTNMNANEVIAHRATELLEGGASVHANDHVNFGQSSNDVIPTAIHVSARVAIEEELIPALEHMRAALAAKAGAFDGVVKSGRTHLMDATPVRLGQEFAGYAAQVAKGIERVRSAAAELDELALGGTATGTGINTHPEFGGRAIARIAAVTGIGFREADDHFEAQGAKDATVSVAGALSTVATSFMKIADDIRWLGSGPTSGLHEIRLPAVQPGSSIMPGKVNPVIAESVMMVSAQVIGNDVAITAAGQMGNFELLVMLPVMAHNLLESILLLGRASENFARRCVRDIQPDRERCQATIEESLAMCTALAPEIGYEAAAEIAKEAYKTGQTVREVAEKKKVLPPDQLKHLLDPWRMTEPGLAGGSPGSAGG